MKDKIEYILIDINIRKNILVSKIKERIIYEQEGANTIEVILGAAVFAALAILVFNLIAGAIKGKTTDATNIINDAKLN
jgi:Flp pilus assembly pilin Flp